jgi:membrane protease YdiL (CAAX protease family)
MQHSLGDTLQSDKAKLEGFSGSDVDAARSILNANFARRQEQLTTQIAQAEHDISEAYAQEERAKRGIDTGLRYEAKNLQRARGGTIDGWRQTLDQHYADAHSAGFVARDAMGSQSDVTLYRVLTLLMAIWWLSLVLQGEGMNFDTMRRRHPMWEWYLAFPIPRSVVFTAEALAPAASNPFLMLSPVMIAVMVGAVCNSFLAGLCALPIGIPLLFAATIWAKALEVLIMLRSSVRNRSAWFAVLGAIGFLAMFAPLILLQSPSLARKLASFGAPLIDSLPSSRWLLAADDAQGWLRAMGLSTLIGALLALPAFLVMRFATARGLEGGFGSADVLADTGSFELRSTGRWGWLKDPLLRKEWLWLKRDRGALMQLIGVPLVLMSAQYFNLHNILRSVDLTWNKLAGVIIYFGGYLLSIAGPRALLSEGPALMLTLCWPRSLEDTLRMKVRTLFVLVYAMVCACLGVTIWMFPGDALPLIGVALLWPLFGLSVAEKAVTLIRAPSQSGEPEPVPQSQVWAANLGNAAFALGVFTMQWQLAIAAIAMNWVFAGALWQNFRVRLAYLFDPESEPQLRPPTILSSVLAIVGLLEGGAVISIPFLMAFGGDAASFARMMGYGFAAVVVCACVIFWNKKRFVYLDDILTLDDQTAFFSARPILLALGGGALLATVAIGYQQLLWDIPWPQLHDMIEKGRQFFAVHPDVRIAYTIMAVGIAPWVEEFLFRGLMFRAMLPQWGLARATLASAAFFTVLHPWPAWPMVFLLGAGNALLFARTRSLLPCIVMHACYNAVLIYFTL